MIADQPPAEKQVERCTEALPYLEAALENYLLAFHAGHVKVAWAHQGIAECMMKLSQLEKAQEHLDQAVKIAKNNPQRMTELNALGESLGEQRRRTIVKRGSSAKLKGSSKSLWGRVSTSSVAASGKTGAPPSPGGKFLSLVLAAKQQQKGESK